MIARRNAIVIVVDRLGAGFLGPYGNTWIDTPALNQLATQSLLWEFMIATEPTLAGLYRSIGTGRHPLSPAASRELLWDRLQAAGIHNAVLTDDADLLRSDSPFAQIEQVHCGGEDPAEPAADPESAQMAHTFAAAMQWLREPRDSFCLWLHTRGMRGSWDAPHEFRQRFADEDDPAPPAFVSPPDRSLGKQRDPDEILGVNQAYAAQVVLLDMCLEMFLEVLAEQRILDDTLLILTGVRGFPLGERGYLGASGDSLHEELIHIPLLVRRPDQQYAMIRCQTLVQPADLHFSLGDWFRTESPPTTSSNYVNLLAPADERAGSNRKCLVSALGESRSIRTPAWFLCRTPNEPAKLYAKPDDRWEVNDVATRCSDIVEGLSDALQRFEHHAGENPLGEFGELPGELASRAD